MARTVADAAFSWARWPASTNVMQPRAPAGDALKDYTLFLDEYGLQGARIGAARNMVGTDPRIQKIFEDCLEVMKQLGAVIVDPAEVPNFNKFGKTELEVLHYELKADLNKYLASLGSKARVRTMEDVIQFNKENAARVMPYFGQEHLIIAQQKGPLSSRPYREALAGNRRLTRAAGSTRC